MLNAASQTKTADGTLTPASAMRVALVAWLGLGIIPMIFFLYLVWHFAAQDSSVTRPDDGEVWFILSSLYLLLVVPIAFFWRSRLFATYWSGTPVLPSKYLFGMISVWISLVFGGLFSLAGCLKYNTLLPDLLPSLVAFMFFVAMWPSGRAMTHRTGSTEDAALYKEPS